MARPMDNSNRESIYPLVRRALGYWTSHNNVQTSKVSSRILMCHALKDYMYQMDMDKHCTLQGMKLHYKHLDNNDQQDTDDSLKMFSKIFKFGTVSKFSERFHFSYLDRAIY